MALNTWSWRLWVASRPCEVRSVNGHTSPVVSPLNSILNVSTSLLFFGSSRNRATHFSLTPSNSLPSSGRRFLNGSSVIIAGVYHRELPDPKIRARPDYGEDIGSVVTPSSFPCDRVTVSLTLPLCLPFPSSNSREVAYAPKWIFEEPPFFGGFQVTGHAVIQDSDLLIDAKSLL